MAPIKRGERAESPGRPAGGGRRRLSPSRRPGDRSWEGRHHWLETGRDAIASCCSSAARLGEDGGRRLDRLEGAGPDTHLGGRLRLHRDHPNLHCPGEASAQHWEGKSEEWGAESVEPSAIIMTQFWVSRTFSGNSSKSWHISLLGLLILRRCFQWFTERRKKSLFEALEKVKSGKNCSWPTQNAAIRLKSLIWSSSHPIKWVGSDLQQEQPCSSSVLSNVLLRKPGEEMGARLICFAVSCRADDPWFHFLVADIWAELHRQNLHTRDGCRHDAALSPQGCRGDQEEQRAPKGLAWHCWVEPKNSSWTQQWLILCESGCRLIQFLRICLFSLHILITISLNLYQQGKVSLISVHGIHQLHIFVFFLALYHVIFSAMIMTLGRAKVSASPWLPRPISKFSYSLMKINSEYRVCAIQSMQIRGWKEWEREASSIEHEFSNGTLKNHRKTVHGPCFIIL